jgi:hypothetical protein
MYGFDYVRKWLGYGCGVGRKRSREGKVDIGNWVCIWTEQLSDSGDEADCDW